MSENMLAYKQALDYFLQTLQSCKPCNDCLFAASLLLQLLQLPEVPICPEYECSRNGFLLSWTEGEVYHSIQQSGPDEFELSIESGNGNGITWATCKKGQVMPVAFTERLSRD